MSDDRMTIVFFGRMHGFGVLKLPKIADKHVSSSIVNFYLLGQARLIKLIRSDSLTIDKLIIDD